MSFNDWLKSNDAIRTILVEVELLVGGNESTFLLSSKAYQDGSTMYEARVKGSSVKLTESLSVRDNNASISYGDIELDNTDGYLDTLMNPLIVWSNRPIVVKLGDVRWPLTDFETIFSGVVEDVASRSSHVMNIKIRDKLQLLNTPITENELGGSSNNKHSLLPLTFGEVHNISPLLTNPSTLEYQVHQGTIEDVKEIRDNGVPLNPNFNVNKSTGKFTLNYSPFGRVTATVQGAKINGNWLIYPEELIEHIVTTYGENPFTSGDLDLSSTTAVPIGVHISQRTSVLSVVNDIASSVGGRLVMGRDGKLRLVIIDIPQSASISIDTTNTIKGSWRIVEKLPVEAGVRLGFARNYTIQNSLDTRIPNKHKELFAKEWLSVVEKDNAVATAYKKNAEPKQENTLMIVESDASIEAQRRLSLWSTPRIIFGVTTTAEHLSVSLGDAVELTYPRWGLNGGVIGMVVKASPNWSKMVNNIEVLV